MKESPFLAAMKRVVGGIEIDHHLTGFPIEGADTFSDQQGLDFDRGMRWPALRRSIGWSWAAG
jgi:hypothetical protein